MSTDDKNTALSVENLCAKIDGKQIVKDISFDLCAGEWLMLIGPNGAGKSTIIRAISKFLDYDGKIVVEGQDAQKISNIDYAKKIGFLSQKNLVAYDFSVEEIVAMGRYCYKSGVFRSLSKDDKDKIDWALEITGLKEYRERSIRELSGGEVQRTFIAQLFCQDPDILVLDEPTNNLDLMYQEQVFSLIDQWVKEKNAAVLSIVHDLSMAKLYGDKAVLLCDGKAFSKGDIADVFTNDNLYKAYGLDVKEYMRRIYDNW